MSIDTSLSMNRSKSDTQIPLMTRGLSVNKENAESKIVEQSVGKVAKERISRSTSVKLLPKTKEIKNENLFTPKKEQKPSLLSRIFKRTESKESQPVNLIKEEDKPVSLSTEVIEMLKLLKKVIETDDQEALKELCKLCSINENHSHNIALSKEIVKMYRNEPAVLNSLIEKLTRCDLEAQTRDSFFRNQTLSGTLSKVIIEQDPEMIKVIDKTKKELVGYLPSSALDIVINPSSISRELKLKMGQKKYDHLTLAEKDKKIDKIIESNRVKFEALCEKTASFLFEQTLPVTVRQTLEIRKSVIEQSRFSDLVPQGVSAVLMLGVENTIIVDAGKNVSLSMAPVVNNVASVMQKFAKEESTSTTNGTLSPSEITFNAIEHKFKKKYLEFLTTNSTV